MPDLPCKQPQLEQISTGQAGPEVNRDLEQLFRAVNKLIRCVSKASDFLDASSGGSFGGGSGGGTGTNPNEGTVPLTGPQFTSLSSGSSFTLPNYLTGVVYIEATANITVTLGSPGYGCDLLIVNAASGAFTITLNSPDATTIASLDQNMFCRVPTLIGSTGAPAFPTVVPVFGASGEHYLGAEKVFLTNANKLYMVSPDGHFWSAEIDNTGSLVTTDTGTTKPAPAAPNEEPEI